MNLKVVYPGFFLMRYFYFLMCIKYEQDPPLSPEPP